MKEDGKSAENRHEEFHEGMDEEEFYALFPDEKKKDTHGLILKRTLKFFGAMFFVVAAGLLSFSLESSEFIFFILGGFFVALIVIVEDML